MNNFWAGFGLGLGVGVLFAPMRGKDVRELAAVKGSEIADSARKYADTARETYDQVRSKADTVAQSIRGVEAPTGTAG
jgi:gas vesicle protein